MIFEKNRRNASADHRRMHALYEIAITIADFLAAISFVIGSILFFPESTQTVGTWFFLLGSIMFFVSPSIKVMREVKLASMGDVGDLAKRFERE